MIHLLTGWLIVSVITHLLNVFRGFRSSLTLLKKRLRHMCFPVNFAKIFKSTFFTGHFLVAASEETAQLTFTCSKSKIETLEKGVKYVQSLQQKYQNVIDAVLVFLLLTLNLFHIFLFHIYRWLWTSKC